MNKIKFTICLLLFFCASKAQTPDSWTQVADFGGVAREAALAFSIDSFGYVGLGGFPNGRGGFTYSTDLWQYNPYTNLWTQKTNFPGAGRWSAICFVIGSKAYVGLGDNGFNHRDFWEYDPAIDTWTQKADFEGAGRTVATGFSIGGLGYVGLGSSDTSSAMKDFWQYDPATDTWTQKNDFMGLPRINASGFSIGGKGFVAVGYDGTYPLHGLSLNDLWQYDPSSDSWTQKANYPGKAKDGGAFAFTIGNIAYLGTGFDSTYKCYSDFWKYNPQTDTWIQKDSFGGGIRNAAVAFSIGNRGYAGGGDTPNFVCFNDFWMYTPDSLPTGIRGIDESSIHIYPDPVSDRLIIDNLAPHTPIIIMDMLGKVMIQKIAESTKISIDVSALPPGVYCVNNRKFVKE